MKKLIIISVGLLGFNSNVTAQNIPDGSSLPSGSMNGIVTTPYNFGQSPNPGLSTYNFTREFVPLAPMSSIPAFENSNGAAVVVNTTYTDGFGNKLMTVNRNNAGSDIVVPYNNRPSRTSVSYLGYPA